MKNDCSVMILAAGNSSRMGKPKFLLEMPSEISFLENIAKQYSDFGCAKIIIVLNNQGVEMLKANPQQLPVNAYVVLNPNHELGRFSSIKAGLKLVNSTYIFIHNIDNPYAKHEILEQIYSHRYKANVIKPIINSRGGHPILISKNVCEDILLEKENDINFKNYLRSYSTIKVEVIDNSIFININTNEELDEFRKRIIVNDKK